MTRPLHNIEVGLIPLRWVLYTDLVGSTVANCMMRSTLTCLTLSALSIFEYFAALLCFVSLRHRVSCGSQVVAVLASASVLSPEQCNPSSAGSDGRWNLLVHFALRVLTCES